MSIRAAKRPSRLYDRTGAAIAELDPDDQAELLDVIQHDPSYTSGDIADYLNQQTNGRHRVDKASVNSYRQKLRQGKATI